MPMVCYNYKLPENIEVVDFKRVPSLKTGEEQLLTLQFFANKNYTDSIIPVKFEITGADITNVNDIDLSVAIDQPVRKTY